MNIAEPVGLILMLNAASAVEFFLSFFFYISNLPREDHTLHVITGD